MSQKNKGLKNISINKFVEVSKMEYVCEPCNFKCTTKNKMSRHESTNKHKKGAPITNYKCEPCNFKTNNRSLHTKHLLTNKCKSNKCEDVKKVDIIYECKICKYSSKNKQYFNSHLKTKRHIIKCGGVCEKSYDCVACCYKTGNFSDYKFHLTSKKHTRNMSINEPEAIYNCLCCFKTFKNQSLYSHHILTKKHKKIKKELSSGEIKKLNSCSNNFNNLINNTDNIKQIKQRLSKQLIVNNGKTSNETYNYFIYICGLVNSELECEENINYNINDIYKNMDKYARKKNQLQKAIIKLDNYQRSTLLIRTNREEEIEKYREEIKECAKCIKIVIQQHKNQVKTVDPTEQEQEQDNKLTNVSPLQTLKFAKKNLIDKKCQLLKRSKIVKRQAEEAKEGGDMEDFEELRTKYVSTVARFKNIIAELKNIESQIQELDEDDDDWGEDDEEDNEEDNKKKEQKNIQINKYNDLLKFVKLRSNKSYKFESIGELVNKAPNSSNDYEEHIEEFQRFKTYYYSKEGIEYYRDEDLERIRTIDTDHDRAKTNTKKKKHYHNKKLIQINKIYNDRLKYKMTD